MRYAGASGDFNPMHHDDTIATQVGNPSVFGHGMLTAGLMARVVKDWFGPEAMRRFQVRFAKQVWPGETLTFAATVTASARRAATPSSTSTSRRRTPDGEVKLTGTATAAVVARSGRSIDDGTSSTDESRSSPASGRGIGREFALCMAA